MGTIVVVILLAIVVAQDGLAECNVSERNGRFIVEDSCNVYQEYKDLEKLQTSQNCTDENKVWAILERLYRHGGNGPSCMHKAIRQLGQTHHDSTTPSYCACSGSIKLDIYHANANTGDHLTQCFRYHQYVQLFETYFTSSGNHHHQQLCQSHHKVWNVLAGISSDICRLDIVLHVADKYHRLPDPCSCQDVNPVVTGGITTASSLPSDHCLQYHSYEYLYLLSIDLDQCVSVNNMWSYLADIHRNDSKCWQELIDHMSKTFHGYEQSPQHCVCTGHDIQRHTVDLPHLDQVYCNSHHPNYRYLHDEIYANSPSPCRSHQYMWHYLGAIMKDQERDCKEDLILYAQATYPDTASDPCSCSSASQSSEKSTVSATIETALTTKTVILDATTTLESLLVHICSKVLTIADAAHNLTIKHPNASDCTTGDHVSSEALVLSNCNVGSATLWIKGENVMEMCHRIPLYAPVATFDALGVYHPNGGRAGIFLGCIQDGFRVAAQDCNQGVSFQHITRGGAFKNDPSNYFIIRW